MPNSVSNVITVFVDLQVAQNETFDQQIEFFGDDGTPLDLSPYLLTFTVYSATTAVAQFTDGDGFVITGNVLTFDTLIGMNAGCDYNYELRAVRYMNWEKTFMRGKFIVV